MKYLDITVVEVACGLGVAQPSVSNWRNGKTIPAQEHLRGLAKILRQSVDWILFGNKTELGPEVDKCLTDIVLKLDRDVLHLLRTPGIQSCKLREFLQQMIISDGLTPVDDDSTNPKSQREKKIA